jgi:hypothetical protein
MLTKLEFITKGYKIELIRNKELDNLDLSAIEITELKTKRKQIIDLDTIVMRRLAKIISDSPFIFSDNNNEK